MCQINFVEEFRSIIAESYKASLTCQERMLWIALFYAANERAQYNGQTQTYDWPETFFTVANAELYLYCALEKRAIEATRNRLSQKGYIRFIPGDRNKRNPSYALNYLSRRAGSRVGYNFVPNNDTNITPNRVPNNAPTMYPTVYPTTPQQCTKRNEYYYINQDSSVSERERGDARAGGFIPPSLDEVRDYCRERENRINPKRFMAYFEKTHWNVPPDFDWRAAIRSWETLPYDRNAAPPSRYTNEELSRLEINLGAAGAHL